MVDKEGKIEETEVNMADILLKTTPLDEDSLTFQRNLRDEWS